MVLEPSPSSLTKIPPCLGRYHPLHTTAVSAGSDTPASSRVKFQVATGDALALATGAGTGGKVSAASGYVIWSGYSDNSLTARVSAIDASYQLVTLQSSRLITLIATCLFRVVRQTSLLSLLLRMLSPLAWVRSTSLVRSSPSTADQTTSLNFSGAFGPFFCIYLPCLSP